MGRRDRLADHFSIGIPIGRASNPITKKNWEGTGVIPDVSVAADHALQTAYRLALTQLVEKTPGPNLKEERTRALAEMSAPPMTEREGQRG